MARSNRRGEILRGNCYGVQQRQPPQRSPICEQRGEAFHRTTTSRSPTPASDGRGASVYDRLSRAPQGIAAAQCRVNIDLVIRLSASARCSNLFGLARRNRAFTFRHLSEGWADDWLDPNRRNIATCRNIVSRIRHRRGFQAELTRRQRPRGASLRLRFLARLSDGQAHYAGRGRIGAAWDQLRRENCRERGGRAEKPAMAAGSG